ncbi:acVLRF1 family peptidyl-tRNA hydrolase [Tenggerimyces flavus]|uniref:AcVLRF1 family peptidyl-tRNA hydrolase n=1 Tax=Tenggerimyces flavus TaxID=1708749 RepID=A0ABV7YM71_9ACTN|nr:acVLRF1 family peptidyl-tRNA hydrolase [Tenggerimyces flavus]MBM7787333.1 hypothetical protein [Tenggerimyces flavus]
MRELTVGVARLSRWLAGFGERHGEVSFEAAPLEVVVTAADGAVAVFEVPFAPLSVADSPYGGLVEHATRDRRVGVLLVRRGGYAAGVFEGSKLLVSKVGSRHVQGRTAAGGWSQQRFARRREKQAREAMESAADVVARVLLPEVRSLDAVIVGGDRPSVAAVLDTPRLAPLKALVVPPHLNVPDPRHAVLQRTPDDFRVVRIRLTEPGD